MTFFKSDELNELAVIAEASNKWRRKSQMTGENGEKMQIWECRDSASLNCRETGVVQIYPTSCKDYRLTEGFDDAANKAQFKAALVDSVTTEGDRYEMLFDLLFRKSQSDLSPVTVIDEWRQLLRRSKIAFYEECINGSGLSSIIIESEPDLPDDLSAVNNGHTDLHMAITFGESGTKVIDCFIQEQPSVYGDPEEYARFYGVKED